MSIDPGSAVGIDPAAWCFVGLGSNLGDSPRIVREAMDALQMMSGIPLARSSLYRSAPLDCPEGAPPFVNAVVGLGPKPEDTPESLLARLQALERRFGRQPKRVMNEPRELDLDLLTFHDKIRSTPALVLPHPRLHERRFVLQPWNEIAPDFVVPGRGRTVRELLDQLPGEGDLEWLQSPAAG